MSFTYDASSSRGRVRLLIADTNAASYTFEDDEIDAFLALADQNVLLGAAFALRSLCADKSKFAVYYMVRGFTMDRRYATEQLLKLATALEDRVMATPFEIEAAVEEFVDYAGRDLGNYIDSRMSTD